MSLTYFKRYRMEVDLRGRLASVPPLPAGYGLVAWDARGVCDHAEAKFHAFRNEIDSSVFGCLGSQEGCRQLMEEISQRDGFLPEATWLVEFDAGRDRRELCGCIQGVKVSPRFGAIQNVGVTPFHRCRGLGRALILASLRGFQLAGLPRAYLEVTAQNASAVKLYQRLGFCRVKTLYKAVELAYS